MRLWYYMLGELREEKPHTKHLFSNVRMMPLLHMYLHKKAKQEE